MDSDVVEVREAILSFCREKEQSPEFFFGALIRQGLDEVIDGPRTGRFSLDQLATTEQTYIGTKIEILVKSELNLEAGDGADAEIGGLSVDIKWSKSLAWMIGPENVDTLCLGLGLSRDGKRFSVGVFRASRADLRPGANRDGKLGLTAAARKTKVDWLVKDAELPHSFIADLSEATRKAIFSERSAQDRVKKLVTLVVGVPIPREAFRTVARNKADPMRRLRRDKYKDAPLGGMVLLSTKMNKPLLRKLGYKHLPKDHWISVPASELDRFKGPHP